MERNSTYGQDLLFLFHLPASSAGASLLGRSYPALGREPSPFRPWSPWCRLMWTLTTAPPLPRSTGILVFWFAGYVLVYGLFLYGYMVLGYVLSGTVTWLLLRSSLPGGGCLLLRSSAVRCRPGHGSCHIPDRSIPGR